MGAGSSYPGGAYGYHVISVTPGSPGHKAGLEPIFDYLVALDGHRLDKLDSTLKDVLEKNENRTVNLTVYSSKKNNCRDVSFTPTRTWGGQGLLGINIRFGSFEGANEHVWHILDVVPGSPAACAGLQSDVDYVLGSEQNMADGDDICSLVENHDGKPLKLYVYSTVLDACRELTVTPNSNWGGEGMLGCDIGFGYLHRIPQTGATIGSADASEPFTVTTGTLPHAQPVAGQVAPPPGVDGFSDVPLGNAAQPLVAQPMPMTSPQYPTMPSQQPLVQPMTSSGPAMMAMPTTSTSLAGIDAGLTALSLSGPGATTSLPPLSTHSLPPLSALDTTLGAGQITSTSPQPSNAPPVISPATIANTTAVDMRQTAPLATVSPLPGATAIPSNATPANVTVVRGPASATVSPLPSTSSTGASPIMPPSTAGQPTSAVMAPMTAPNIELPPMPALTIPNLQLSSTLPVSDAPSVSTAPPS